MNGQTQRAVEEYKVDERKLIEQLRSLTRLRVMWVIGGVVTASSFATILWLLGSFVPTNTGLVEISTYVACPKSFPMISEPPSRSMSVSWWFTPKLGEDEVNAELRFDAPSGMIIVEENPPMCTIVIDRIFGGIEQPRMQQEVQMINISDPIHFRIPHLIQETGFGRHVVDISLYNSSGIFGRDPDALPLTSGFLAVEIPASLSVTGSEPIPDSLFAAVFPDEPTGEKEKRRYHFEKEGGNPGFVVRLNMADSSKVRMERVLLIVASTLFGAGVSALFEAFIAGGVRRVVKG